MKPLKSGVMCHVSKCKCSFKVRYRLYKSSALIPTPIEINTVHIFTPYLFKSDKHIHLYKLRFSKYLFPVGILICNLRAKNSAYLLLLNSVRHKDIP
jgi:hypothetical protein